MKIEKIQQANDEIKKTARSNYSSGLKVKTHIKAGPTDPTGGDGGVHDVRP
jgi:hypothetical protein